MVVRRLRRALMNGIPTPEELLNAIHQRPGMYWGGGDHPFTSLIAFLAGFHFGHTNGRSDAGVSPTDLVPDDFSAFVAQRLCGRPVSGGEAWMSIISGQSPSEHEAFQTFFQLRFAYAQQSKPTGDEPIA